MEQNGSDYIACANLYDGPNGAIVAAPGETCERVNPASLPWLIEAGLIVHRDVALQGGHDGDVRQ